MKKFTILSAILLCAVCIAYGQWTYTNLSSAKKWMGVTSLGSKAYFAGGGNGSSTLNVVESYDVETGTWSNIGPLSISRQVIAGTSCGSKLFFGGGVSANFNTAYSTVDIYNTTTGVWTVANLSVARFDIAAISYGSKVVFAGGCNYSITCTNAVDIYDILTGTWTTSTLSIPRAGMAYAVAGDLAVFAGGFISGGDVSDQVDIYNFSTGVWTTATLSEARVWASAVIVGDKIIIAGGIKYFPDVPSDRIDIFDVSTGIWTTEVLFEPRASISAGAINGKAFFAGGSNVSNGGGTYDYTNIVDVYNGADSSWSVDVLATARNSQGVVAGDYFLVAGGTGDSGLLSSVEILYVPYIPHIIHVPGDYATIQEGIDAAGNGDTVLVAPGTYIENINFMGKKPLLVASNFIIDGDTNHINNTIIDGSQPVNPDIGSVVTFESGEDTTSVLCGFTITGGTGTIESSVNMRMGGGMHIKYSGGKFLNNHIHDNTVFYSGGVYGGGMQLGGPPVSEIPWIVLRDNRIYNNEAKSSADCASGGGFICFYNLIMENNKISHNEANGHLGGDGAGVAIGGAFGLIEVDVHNNEVTYNEAKTDVGTNNYATLGGGMSFYWEVTGIVSNNLIYYNSLEAPGTYWSWGPGVFIQDITSNGFVFENNRVKDNYAITTQSCRGGGVSLLRSGGKYQNNVIQNNSGSHGGGFSIITSNEVGDTAILINNTITGNEAIFGGGIYAMSSKSVILNTIIWGNNATTGPAINQTGSTLEVRYSDVQGDVVWPGDGNLNCTPTFLTDGYHLDLGCQLVNAGIAEIQINGYWYNCPAYDIDGDLRPYLNTHPEIGVDEVPVLETGISVSIQNPFMNLYPNPADQRVTITLENGAVIRALSIYNQVGQNVYRGLPDDNTLDVSKLQPGVYIIEVTTNKNTIREKLILE